MTELPDLSLTPPPLPLPPPSDLISPGSVGHPLNGEGRNVRLLYFLTHGEKRIVGRGLREETSEQPSFLYIC